MKKISLSAAFIVLAFAITVFGAKDKRFMTEKPGPDVFEQMSPAAATEITLAEEVAQKRLRLGYRRPVGAHDSEGFIGSRGHGLGAPDDG